MSYVCYINVINMSYDLVFSKYVVYVDHMTYIDTHLNILASKPKRVHVEGIAPCSHNPSIQIRFKLHSVIGVQVIALSV